MPNYIDTIYNTSQRPKTDYPNQLAAYLCNRFNIKKGERLLELGCGRGDFTKAFFDLGIKAEGLDLEKSSDDMLKNIPVSYINLDTERYPYEDGMFDVVYSKSVIEHLKNPEHFIKETMRILKKGGKTIILTPDWHTQMFIFYDDQTHVRPYTTVGLRDLLRIFDFKNVQSEQFNTLAITWKYPAIKIFSKLLQLLGPVKKLYKNRFIRWSRELMVLGYGEK